MRYVRALKMPRLVEVLRGDFGCRFQRQTLDLRLIGLHRR